MKFDFEVNDNSQNYDSEELTNINNENIEIPIGWSSICFNETINYYTDCHTKTTNLDLN